MQSWMLGLEGKSLGSIAVVNSAVCLSARLFRLLAPAKCQNLLHAMAELAWSETAACHM